MLAIEPETAAWVRDAVAAYESKLLRYAARFSPDLERARDAVQDTFLRLCREDRTKVEDHLAAWLFTVCRNRLLDLQRKEQRMQPLLEDHPEPSADVLSPAAASERRDSQARVLQLLEHLPGREQEIVRLKFQGGLSYKEIAGVMNLTTGNVGYLLHQAIRKVRTQLAAEGELS